MLDEIGLEGQKTRKYYQRRLPEDPAKDYYFIMRDTGKITPLLIEYGFIDNENDLKRLNTNLTDYAEAVVKAVTQYAGYKYIPPTGKYDNTYIVKKGDSLYAIANKFNTTVSDIKKLNNLTSNALDIGQVLILSKPEILEVTGKYKVQAGDSLYKIANQFDTTVKEIINANNLKSTVLTVGQELIIPTKEILEEDNYYIIQKGDSLYSIAKKFSVSVDDIIDTNGLKSNTLQIGDKILIPSTTKLPTVSSQYEDYKVKSGDSLYAIAKKFNTTVDTIKKLNNLSSNEINVNQIIKLPLSKTLTYQVQKGDSLYSIAKKFNTTVEDLKRKNNLSSNMLQLNQLLKI